MTPEVSVEQQREFSDFEKTGFKNPDGVYWDAKTGIGRKFVDGPDQPMTALDAFNLKQSLDKVAKDKKEAEAAKNAAEAARTGGEAEVKAAATEAVTMQHTTMELEVLKSTMGADFVEMMKSFNFEGQRVEGKFKFDKSIKFDGLKSDFKVVLKPIFERGNLQVATKLLNENLNKEAGFKQLEEKNVADFLAEIFSFASAGGVKKAFGKKYSRYTEFKDTIEDKSYDFSYKVAFGQNSSLDASFEADQSQQFEADYKAFDTANPKPVVPTVAEKNLQERANAFRTSVVGKLLGMLGIISVPDLPAGQTETKEQRAARENEAFADALNGNNFFAQIAIFFMGGGAMLQDGGKAVADSIASLDPKYQVLVKSIEARAPKLLAKMANDPKYRASNDVLEAATTGIVDKDKFAEMVKDPAKIPADRLIKLKEGVAANGLTVVLAEGSEMILPKGEFARPRINGEAAGSKDEEKHFKGTLTIVGDLPEGTLFKGKVQFKTAEQQAAAKKDKLPS